MGPSLKRQTNRTKSRSEQAERYSHVGEWGLNPPSPRRAQAQRAARAGRAASLQSSLPQRETNLRGAWRCPGHFRSVKSGSRVDEHPQHPREAGRSAWPAQLAPEGTAVVPQPPAPLTAGNGADTRPKPTPEALLEIQKPKVMLGDPR